MGASAGAGAGMLHRLRPGGPALIVDIFSGCTACDGVHCMKDMRRFFKR